VLIKNTRVNILNSYITSFIQGMKIPSYYDKNYITRMAVTDIAYRANKEPNFQHCSSKFKQACVNTVYSQHIKHGLANYLWTQIKKKVWHSKCNTELIYADKLWKIQNKQKNY
jgi:hypothetical protein